MSVGRAAAQVQVQMTKRRLKFNCRTAALLAHARMFRQSLLTRYPFISLKWRLMRYRHALEQISRTHESRKPPSCLKSGVWSPSWCDFQRLTLRSPRNGVFVADLNAGLEHSMLGGQPDTAAEWLHGKLPSSSEGGHQVDWARIVTELSNISEFMGGAKNRVESGVPWGGSPIQPVALAQL